jgi:tripartite-type tricarboxylate transporter receptor subunit TctC
MTDLIGGQIQVLFNPAVSLMPHHKSGKLRVLAVGTSQRVPELDLPTVAEAGLPGFESSVWFALFVPAGTPRSIIGKLNAEVSRILKDKRVVELFTAAGLIPIGGTPEELATLLNSEIKRWAKVVKDSGARVD